MKNKILIVILFFVATKIDAQKFENLAPTPPMGWNSWNTFQCNINEDMVKATIDIMVDKGLKDAGYKYVVLDDCWLMKERDTITGDLVPDPEKFPHGMKALVEYAHSKGLKFGLYNCAGTQTCAGYPGTRGNEYQDARFYASLGIDYLKFDWCFTDGQNAKESYSTMSKALKKAGRPIVFSLCEWGTNKPWEWAKPIGQLWRTTSDITIHFNGLDDHGGSWTAYGVTPIIDMNEKLRKYAGPNAWNDPDMLEVGNGLTQSEDRAHFSIWCMMAAPLMMGNDLRKMNDTTLKILTNKEAIAIDQDPLGIQGLRYSYVDSVGVWFKPLQNGDWAFCVLNRSANAKQINFNWKKENVVDTVFNYSLNANKNIYTLKNIWTNQMDGDTKKPLQATVPPHDVLMYRMVRK